MRDEHEGLCEVLHSCQFIINSQATHIHGACFCSVIDRRISAGPHDLHVGNCYFEVPYRYSFHF